MLSVAIGSKVFLASEPIDLRRGHDGLCALVRTCFGMDPLDGHLFVFVGRLVDRVKVLFWDRLGFVLYYKRLAPGRPTRALSPLSSYDGTRADGFIS